ncbi:hypothetical protein OIDMADRAFT_61000 [Oidiodendron maius Zn]|uniref:Uncharacterized protein n=1 Tax=Oidiodendron maius (strain Zn) TaxID=913774 RepID=A0A0C3CWV3_OIDMZ|nr:hypothetical protein OIDMADRAFT_61000 [Oidiodendron maius Zn]
MRSDNLMRFRPSALMPFILSITAFVLVLVLVLSGTNPNLIPDGYLLSVNTTSAGQNLVEFRSASPVTTATNVVRDTRSAELSQSSSASSAAPTLIIPKATAPTNQAAIPISLIGTFFQLILNTFASGQGDTLQGIVSTLITTEKQSLGVSQYYTIHLSGICEGSALNANATYSTLPFNLTRCVSYGNAGAYIANLTSTVSDSTLIAATNITVPALGAVPSIGKTVQSLIDLVSALAFVVFVISLFGNGLSIFLSAVAFFAPSYGRTYVAGAAITTISTQLLQVAALTSTILAVSINKAINNSSAILGISAAVGGKFLALIWAAYVAAQMANGYWIATWFVKFRTVSYKARHRTPQQMRSYKGIWREILSDLRLQKMEHDDAEMPIKRRLNIRHWDEKHGQR